MVIVNWVKLASAVYLTFILPDSHSGEQYMNASSLYKTLTSIPYSRRSMQDLIDETQDVVELPDILRACIERSLGIDDGLSLTKCLFLGVANGYVWDASLTKQVFRSAEDNLPLQYLFEPYGDRAVPILLDLVEEKKKLPKDKLALAFQILVRHCRGRNRNDADFKRLVDDLRKSNEYFSGGYSEASLLFANCIHFLSGNNLIAEKDKLVQQYPTLKDTSIPLVIDGILERSIFDRLPVNAHAQYEDVPLVRKDEKIGRNAPCPCGSGKKYKHCCLKNGVTVENAYISAHEKNFLEKEHDVHSFSVSEIADLSLDEVKTLQYREMDRHQLAAAKRNAERCGDFHLALSFLTEMRKFYVDTNGVLPGKEIKTTIGVKKIILPKYDDLYDDYVFDLVNEFEFEKRLDLVEKTLDLFFDKASDSFKLAQFLDQLHKNNREQVLHYVEDFAFNGITEPDRLAELFYALKDHYPGLSFTIFRSIVGAFPERVFDIDTMIDSVTDMVVKHNIPYEEEPAIQTFDDLYELRNQSDADSSNLKEIKELQGELRQARKESAKLGKQSEALKEKLETASSSTPSREKDKKENAKEADSPDERETLKYKTQIESSKSKILHLQEIIRSKQDSIQELKQQVKESQKTRVDVEREDSRFEGEIDAAAIKRDGVHIPEYSKEFKKTLETADSAVSRNALRAITGFATKDERYLKQTKTLKALDSYYSIRIGIHHRLILECSPDGTPVAKQLIHRKELESLVKRLKK